MTSLSFPVFLVVAMVMWGGCATPMQRCTENGLELSAQHPRGTFKVATERQACNLEWDLESR